MNVFISFLEMLKIVIKTCCLDRTRIIYLPPIRSINELCMVYPDSSHHVILAPQVAVREAKTSFGMPFVKFLDSPDVAYVQIDKASEVILRKLLTSMLSNWPLFAVIALLTIMGGVIIWFLVNCCIFMYHVLLKLVKS